MTVPNRFKKLLTGPAKDRPVLDAVASTGEAVADIVMKDDLLAAVPFVGTAFKVVKAMDSYRDRLFVEKLQAFVAGIEPLQPGEREQLAKKFMADDEGRKTGETLLLVLDKLTDMDKPALLGAMVRHFALGRIGSADLRRLANAIDLGFADDLAAFLYESPESTMQNSEKLHREGLVASGLTRVLTGDSFDTAGTVFYGVTALGETLHALANRQD